MYIQHILTVLSHMYVFTYCGCDNLVILDPTIAATTQGYILYIAIAMYIATEVRMYMQIN